MKRGDSGLTIEQWLARAERGVGLVFADIVGSALLVHGEGTKVYARILSAYRSRADELVAGLDGWVVSREGDEIFSAFLSATSAYRFARAMFEDAGHPQVAVRIGVHFGTVSSHDSGLVGRVIPFAARVMAHAAPHEVWVSDAAKRALEAESLLLANEISWITSEQCLLDGIPAPQLLWRAA
jgi:adenylate cyclase